MADLNPFTIEDKHFFQAIRNDIIRRPDFYKVGVRYVSKQFGVDAQYRDDLAEWKYDKTFGHKRTKPKRKPDNPLFILGPAFAGLEHRGIDMPDDDLRDFDLDAAKAVIVITWLLTDKDAHAIQLGKRFGTWNHSRGRKLARAGTLDESGRRENWMKIARQAWELLRIPIPAMTDHLRQPNASKSQPMEQSKDGDDPKYRPSKWFDTNGPCDGATIRKAVHDGEKIRKIPGRGRHNLYSLVDVERLWGPSKMSEKE